MRLSVHELYGQSFVYAVSSNIHFYFNMTSWLFNYNKIFMHHQRAVNLSSDVYVDFTLHAINNIDDIIVHVPMFVTTYIVRTTKTLDLYISII